MEMTMGMRIRECRVKMGMTQEELAGQICCKKSLISQYENDKVDIKGSIIVELAEYLGTTTGYLLNGEIECDLVRMRKKWWGLCRCLRIQCLRRWHWIK